MEDRQLSSSSLSALSFSEVTRVNAKIQIIKLYYYYLVYIEVTKIVCSEVVTRFFG